MAFQVVDDILDVTASDEQLGKPAGNDMLEGVYSLPVIHTLHSSFGPDLRTLLSDEMTRADRLDAIDIVRNGPGVASALDGCRTFRRARPKPSSSMSAPTTLAVLWERRATICSNLSLR